MINNVWHLIVIHFRIFKIVESIHVAKIKHLNIDAKSLYKNDTFYYNTYIVFNEIVVILLGLFIAIPKPNDENIFFYTNSKKQSFVKIKAFFNHFCRFNFVFILYIQNAAYSQVIYFLKQVNYEQRIILCLIKKMQNNHSLFELKAIKTNIKFQAKVRRQLIFCWKRYADLHEYFSI